MLCQPKVWRVKSTPIAGARAIRADDADVPVAPQVANTHTHSPSHTYTLTHSHTLTLTHSHTHTLTH